MAGATVIHRLVTRYELDDQYTRSQEDITDATRKFGQEQQRTGRAMRTFMGEGLTLNRVLNTTGTTLRIAGVGLTAIAAGASAAAAAVAGVYAGIIQLSQAAGEDAKLAWESFGNSIEGATQQAGQALNQTLLPQLEMLEDAIREMTDAGIFEQLGRQLADTFLNFEVGEDAMLNFAAIAGSVLSELINEAARLREMILGAVDGAFDAWNAIQGGIYTATQGAFGGNFKARPSDAMGAADGGAGTSFFDRVAAGAELNRRRLIDNRDKREAEGRSLKGEASGEPASNGGRERKDNPYLQTLEAIRTSNAAIERNTRPDDVAGIIGGGDIGRRLSETDLGITPGRRAGSRRVSVNVSGGNEIDQFIAGRVMQVIQTLQREGSLA